MRDCGRRTCEHVQVLASTTLNFTKKFLVTGYAHVKLPACMHTYTHTCLHTDLPRCTCAAVAGDCVHVYYQHPHRVVQESLSVLKHMCKHVQTYICTYINAYMYPQVS